MNKKVVILALILLFLSNAAFAIRAVTKEEHEAYLKSLGLNKTKIEKLQEIDLIYLNKQLEADKLSREYRRQNPNLTKEDYNRYHQKVRMEAEKAYQKDLNKILNYWQKKKYIEYKSRIY